jgi:CheY-like chemotaxis protein
VSDTGCGIPLEKQSSIFEPFVQADTSTSRKYGGTGLGLAITGQLVELMGGQCGVASILGQGSTFWFTIRVGASGPEATPQPQPSLAGLTALIVDDDVGRSAMLSEHLSDWGMVVAVADSEPGALDMLRRGAASANPFAVALLDQSTPGVNGLQLASAIHDEEALDVVVFVMGCRGVFSAPGVSEFLARPIRFGELQAQLQAAMTPREPRATKPRSGRLLLAEDNPINQKVALAMLSSGGYSVDTVLDGVAAVQAAADGEYDAILMDCQMPMLNGYEAAAAIRLHEGDQRHTPIIAMTAGARREDRASCYASGMDSYISKPVSKQRLLATLAAFVSERVA